MENGSRIILTDLIVRIGPKSTSRGEVCCIMFYAMMLSIICRSASLSVPLFVCRLCGEIYGYSGDVLVTAINEWFLLISVQQN